jgi:hypothetical protein
VRAAYFVPVLFARNLACGATIWALSLMGERKAVGVTCALLALLTGPIDVMWCLEHGREGGWVGHVVGTALLGMVAWGQLGA